MGITCPVTPTPHAAESRNQGRDGGLGLAELLIPLIPLTQGKRSHTLPFPGLSSPAALQGSPQDHTPPMGWTRCSGPVGTGRRWP